MSAYVVSDKHITALIRAGLQNREARISFYQPGADARETIDCTNAEEFARDLKRENQQSVSVRYRTPGDYSDLPGMADSGDEWAGSLGIVTSILGRPLLERVMNQPSPVAILKAISSYEYQTCEHDEWTGSRAQAFCEALRGQMIRDLPGYDEADWEISA